MSGPSLAHGPHIDAPCIHDAGSAAPTAGLVSVCVATCNGEPYVAEQLRSVLASQRVFHAAEPVAAGKQIDELHLKGLSRPVRVFDINEVTDH